MTRIAIVFHSRDGHTKIIAEEIAKGVQSVAGAQVELISVTETIDWETLNASDAIIFGSPTYLGSVSGEFKMFMDSTSDAWFNHKWKDKFAAGFTTSHSYSGDKLGVLIQMAIFAAQHGMIWINGGDKREGPEPHHVNRLGSFMGVMAQCDPTLGSDLPPLGDRKTAFNLGVRVAETSLKFKR